MISTSIGRAIGSLALCGALASLGAISPERRTCVAKAHRFTRHGWVYLHLEGGAAERGFQHGFLGP